MQSSPIAIVQERFGKDRKVAKQKLVEVVRKLGSEDIWISRLNKDKGLEFVSNGKLLRLERVLGDVKKSLGSRDKLIAKILELEARSKDAEYKERLSAYATPRLWDHYRSLQTRTKSKSQKPSANK